jgi:hypothetical protein
MILIFWGAYPSFNHSQSYLQKQDRIDPLWLLLSRFLWWWASPMVCWRIYYDKLQIGQWDRNGSRSRWWEKLLDWFYNGFLSGWRLLSREFAYIYRLPLSLLQPTIQIACFQLWGEKIYWPRSEIEKPRVYSRALFRLRWFLIRLREGKITLFGD